MATPNCPAWLNDAAKRYWRHYAKTLTITDRNRDQVAILCDQLAQYETASRLINEEGMEGKSFRNNRILSQFIKAKTDAAKMIRTLMRDLDMEADTLDPLSEFRGR